MCESSLLYPYIREGAYGGSQLVDELLVECIHHSAGCMHTCQRQHLANHLEEACLYSEVPCPEGICDKRFRRGEADVHTHDPNVQIEECTECSAKFRVENLDVSY